MYYRINLYEVTKLFTIMIIIKVCISLQTLKYSDPDPEFPDPDFKKIIGIFFFVFILFFSLLLFFLYILSKMQRAEILELAGLRLDGRKPHEMRPLQSKIGLIQHADGSCYLEQGLNKVLALVQGPHEPSKKLDNAGEKVRRHEVKT